MHTRARGAFCRPSEFTLIERAPDIDSSFLLEKKKGNQPPQNPFAYVTTTAPACLRPNILQSPPIA